ncbi:hypothetical protein NSQ93_04055 [Bacillus sp. FSL W8-0445]|jgi:hypothetical protein|uniref:Uncharacterized protein n=2 Tax=Bacteria TaxID=2 RepID=A0AB37GLH8_BACLI|nr:MULTISPECIES: hypothetical protein [Bacillus]MBJ7887926.1 hypothetical protein [Bacillaceae bacterium HSR45]ATI75690.1 hypothetical protein CPQ91_07520 [Bacillus licheniformis]KAA0812315.1 hypothetical protein EI978_03920 [Bacillus licheniformis]KAA0827240.1 hypothetical protein EI976_09395 [Bacillus licheniformis]KAA0838737.1 hypothetical protein EI973_08730 [Bacillus licheniformis]
MAIDYKDYSYHKYMDGVEITETDTGIIISEFDLIDGDTKHHFDAVSISLDKDDEFPVLYELFIVKDADTGSMKYHLDKTYIDGVFLPAYSGTYKLLHTFMGIEVSPSGEKKGFIVPLVKPPEKEGNSNDPT